MEGLKLIAQSTFDRHQKFRPGPAGPGASGEGAPYRYNVIEIGAFAGTAPTSSSTVTKRQSCSGAPASSSRQNGSSTGSPSRVSLNEWMVHEDDLGAFMKKRPVHVSSSPAPAPEQQQQQQSQDAPDSGTATNSSTGMSRSASLPSSRMTRSGTSNTTATAATSGSTASAPARRNTGSSGREEVDAVASLKLVCIQRAADLDSDDDDAGADPNSNTLAISRETFLRLYVDNMDADHCALYYLAREYDGFLEFNDSSKSIATKFIGTSDYALIWTFNRRTLETKGLFIDRCHRWQAKDTAATPAPAAHSTGGSVPVTPVRKIGPGDSSSVHSTPSRKWTQNKSGTVAASAAWHVFRDTLNMYRTYVFAPQLLSFVCCVHMLRTYDDQVNGDDLPLIKDAETSITAAHEAALLQGAAAAADDDDDQQMNAHQRRGIGVGGSLLPTQSTGSFVIAPEHNPFAPSTPPSEAEKMIHSTTAPPATTAASAHRAAAAERHRLLSHALAGSRVDTSLSNKLRHLRTTRTMLESIAREHETVVVDVVASEFLDRYHRSMEGMTEAVPALERHVASLEEYLRYLKGRSERLSSTLVRHLNLLSGSSTCLACAPPPPHHPHATSSSRATQSDSLSLRCNEADSRSGRGSGCGGTATTTTATTTATTKTTATAGLSDRGGATGLGISAAFAALGARGQGPRPRSRDSTEWERERGPGRRGERGEVDSRGRSLGFYAGYLLRGNYSHRLA